MKKILLGAVCCLSLFAYACNKAATPEEEFANYVQAAADKSNKGDFKGAIEDYKNALNIKPDSPDILVKLSDLQMRTEDTAAALENSNKAVALRGTGVDYLHNAEAKYSSGKYQEAMADVEKSLSVDPNDPWAYFVRAEIKLATGDKKGAMDDVVSAMGKDADKAGFRHGVYNLFKARLEREIGDKKVALENMDAGIKIMKSMGEGFVPNEEIKKLEDERADMEKGLNN